MKVKMFKNCVVKDLERDMNTWLNENPNIKLIKVNQSSVYENITTSTIISIFYEQTYRKPDTGPK